MVETINKAYNIFGRYKLKEEVDVCTQCCVTQEEKLKLETGELRNIPYKLIYTHNTAATSTKPPIEEFKYFIPRYLELVSKNQFPSHSIELSLKRFEKYNLEEFEKEELEIIEDFCQKYFKEVLSNYPTPENEGIDSILIMLYKAKCNIKELLIIWKADKSKIGNRHFTDFVNFALSKKGNKLINPFSSEKLDEIIEDWLKDDELYETKYEKINHET